MSDESNESGWPEGVVERLTAYAERVGITQDEALQEFTNYLLNDFTIDNPREEEEEVLVDLAEGFLLETRRARGGGSGVEYVGHFTGVNGKWSDRRESMRGRLAQAYSTNPDAAIESGAVGVFRVSDGKWMLETKAGVTDTGEEVREGQLPENSFRTGDAILAALVKNPESPNYGKPFGAYDENRYIYFLGNEKGSFEDEIVMWRIAANPRDEVRLGVPCKFKGRPPREDAAEAWRDVIEVSDGWVQNISYTDDFVDPDLRADLRADRFWVNEDFHDYYVELDELVECYEAKKQALSNGEGYFGPIVLTKGFVVRMSTEPVASERDQTGRNFSMDLSSMALQQAYGDDRAEVRLWIPGAVSDLTHPFEFHDGAGWAEYAERSTIMVCGRIGLRASGDHFVPKLNVLGVYALPNRARRRQSGGDTSLSQF